MPPPTHDWRGGRGGLSSDLRPGTLPCAWCLFDGRPAAGCRRCDNITISPALLGELEASTQPLPRKLSPDKTDSEDEDLRGRIRGPLFSQLHEADQMAVDKLKQGEGGGWDRRGVCVWGS